MKRTQRTDVDRQMMVLAATLSLFGLPTLIWLAITTKDTPEKYNEWKKRVGYL